MLSLSEYLSYLFLSIIWKQYVLEIHILLSIGHDYEKEVMTIS